ncbi:hypothetical protein IQ06DRAFT_308529 [Phaeosphaeriaceae sp. SRC1lsM3a]|nr:hypothetical protein IQ06DRAFT_308529 [Stagonospora sp. SRC1lsM3a]
MARSRRNGNRSQKNRNDEQPQRNRNRGDSYRPQYGDEGDQDEWNGRQYDSYRPQYGDPKSGRRRRGLGADDIEIQDMQRGQRYDDDQGDAKARSRDRKVHGQRGGFQEDFDQGPARSRGGKWVHDRVQGERLVWGYGNDERNAARRNRYNGGSGREVNNQRGLGRGSGDHEDVNEGGYGHSGYFREGHDQESGVPDGGRQGSDRTVHRQGRGIGDRGERPGRGGGSGGLAGPARDQSRRDSSVQDRGRGGPPRDERRARGKFHGARRDVSARGVHLLARERGRYHTSNAVDTKLTTQQFTIGYTPTQGYAAQTLKENEINEETEENDLPTLPRTPERGRSIRRGHELSESEESEEQRARMEAQFRWEEDLARGTITYDHRRAETPDIDLPESSSQFGLMPSDQLKSDENDGRQDKFSSFSPSPPKPPSPNEEERLRQASISRQEEFTKAEARYWYKKERLRVEEEQQKKHEMEEDKEPERPFIDNDMGGPHNR